jgi:endogenous inhibitor of DNA gyrase (YacG/DUF329 family)
MPKTILCEQCGKKVKRYLPSQRFCSIRCRRIVSNRRLKAAAKIRKRPTYASSRAKAGGLSAGAQVAIDAGKLGGAVSAEPHHSWWRADTDREAASAADIRSLASQFDKAGTEGGSGSFTAGVLLHEMLDKTYAISQGLSIWTSGRVLPVAAGTRIQTELWGIRKGARCRWRIGARFSTPHDAVSRYRSYRSASLSAPAIERGLPLPCGADGPKQPQFDQAAPCFGQAVPRPA